MKKKTNLLNRLFDSFAYICIGIVLGALLIYFFIPPEMEIDIYGKWLTQHTGYDQELRSLAVNLTRDCQELTISNEDRKLCQLTNLVDFFNDFDYVDGRPTVYPPKDTIKNRAGDCDDLAYAFSSVANQIGLNVEVKCSKNHCWNIINFNNKFYYHDKLYYDATIDLLTKKEGEITNQLN